MATAKQKRELKNWVKKLNKAKLAEAIDLDQDYDDLKEDFLDTMEELDDNDKLEDLDEKMIDFFNAFVDEGEEEDEEPEDEEEPEEEEEEDEPEEEEEEEEDEGDEYDEMSRSELVKVAKGLGIKCLKSMSEDDYREAIRGASKKSGKKTTAKKTTKKAAAKKAPKKRGTPIQQFVIANLKKYKGKKVTQEKIQDLVCADREAEGMKSAVGIIKQYVKVICESLIGLGYATGDDKAVTLKKK